MITMLIAGTVWLVLACVAAFVVARVVRLADEQSASSWTDDLASMSPPDESPRARIHSATELPGPRRPNGRHQAGTPVG